MLVGLIIAFSVFGYLFTIFFIKTVKTEESHHQYSLYKHMTAILFVLSSLMFVMIMAGLLKDKG
ncbi:MAG: hypothetical protein H0Z32_11840 [Bacillaceae bacterium]|nr:hypothetical protein [Bacillaceae bacterium]